ncbi:amidohydrolase family protein [Microbacteriaceae bacterium VKM Ac-2854]|nr:amidohydrolase family protein [Microbacteriaceae bacterium VKM Ac-2854]
MWTERIRVDAHQHVWDPAVRAQPWTAGSPTLQRAFTLDDVRPSLAAAGIGGTVLVQTVNSVDETEELLAQAAGEHAIAGVVGWTDLESPAVSDALAALTAHPGGAALVGIRHQVQEEPDPEWLLRPSVLRGLRAVAAAGLAFDLVIVPRQLPAAIGAARAVPELRFVLDHGGKPDIRSGRMRPWREEIAALAALPNVSAKLSGLFTSSGIDGELDGTLDGAQLARIRPYSDELLQAFGAQRLMFGSDWPVSSTAGSYAAVLAATAALLSALAEAERAAVIGGTAACWYRGLR